MRPLLHGSKDPGSFAILFADSAAIVGLLIAFIGEKQYLHRQKRLGSRRTIPFSTRKDVRRQPVCGCDRCQRAEEYRCRYRLAYEYPLGNHSRASAEKCRRKLRDSDDQISGNRREDRFWLFRHKKHEALGAAFDRAHHKDCIASRSRSTTGTSWIFSWGP